MQRADRRRRDDDDRRVQASLVSAWGTSAGATARPGVWSAFLVTVNHSFGPVYDVRAGVVAMDEEGRTYGTADRPMDVLPPSDRELHDAITYQTPPGGLDWPPS